MRFDTVITGAGVSKNSGVWDGDTFAANVWSELRATALADVRTVIDLPRDVSSMRLEHLMEVISSVLPTDEHGAVEEESGAKLSAAYSVMADAAPNQLHRLIRDIEPATIATVNIELLHEKAGSPAVIHLHGDLAHLSEVSTRISQYRLGLPTSLKRRLYDAVHDKDVLVVGYSGRDRDVLPLIERAQPRYLTWLLYKDPQRGWTETPSPQVAAFLDRLEREGHGCRVETDLPSFLGAMPDSASPAFQPDPRIVRDALRTALNAPQRILATSRVSYELGHPEAAIALLKQAWPLGGNESPWRKSRARALRRTGRRWAALCSLTPPSSLLLSSSAWREYGNELLSLTRQLPALARVAIAADRSATRSLVRDRSRWPYKVAIAARTRRAHDLLDAGRITESLALQREAADTHSDHTQDLGSVVVRVTWLAEALTLHNDPHAALERLEEADDDAHYVNSSQYFYYQWARFHAELERGDDWAQIQKRMQQLQEIAHQTGDAQARLWSEIAAAHARLRHGHSVEPATLERIRALLRSDNGTSRVQFRLLRLTSTSSAAGRLLALLAAELQAQRGSLRGTWHKQAQRALTPHWAALLRGVPLLGRAALGRAVKAQRQYGRFGCELYAMRLGTFVIDLRLGKTAEPPLLL